PSRQAHRPCDTGRPRGRARPDKPSRPASSPPAPSSAPSPSAHPHSSTRHRHRAYDRSRTAERDFPDRPLVPLVPVFLIYGTFMRSQPGHANLDGARFVGSVETKPRYRLFEVDGRWPALIEDDDGVGIAAELYEIDATHVVRLAEL